MKKFLVFTICLGLLSVFAMNASAVESLVDDFDDGTNPGYWGGDIWNSTAGNEAGQNGYSDWAYIGPSGKSFGVGWSGIDASGEWIGGGENLAAGTGDAGVDISTYTTLSFWIYTPNSNTKVDVELKAPGSQIAKLHLQDYLTTGTSVWQEVCIPLQAFVRQNPNLDLSTATCVSIVGEYDLGSVDVDGQVYVDNLRFTIQEHAPANSTVFSGDNKGASGEADVAGDTLLWWDQATSTVTCNEVRVRVSTGYAISWVTPLPGDEENLSPGATAYFSYKLRNDGNIGDRIVFSTESVTGFSYQWPARVYWDKDASGSYTAGDVEHWDAIGLCPDSTHYFLLAVMVPSDAVDQSSASVRTWARDANGAGTNDSWPTGADDDTRTDEVVAKVSVPVITVVKSTSTASGKPGDSVEYYIKITNSGSEAATNLQLVDVVPFYTHLTAEATGCLSDDSIAPTVEYWDGSTWGAGYTGKSKVKWAWSSVGTGLTAYCTFYVGIE